MSEIDCTMDIEPQLPVFPDSSRLYAQEWMDRFNNGTLSCAHFKDHWRVWVPHIFGPPNKNCLDWTFDEERAQKVLFNTLKEFICNGDPKIVLKNLSQSDCPPSVCGRVFKMGEPIYFCRECCIDSTCVLCIDCFKKSVHKNHKYKMRTSSGGGCCDCGDTEAWKQDPYCDVHKHGLDKRQALSSVLPEDIVERAYITFTAVLRYAYQMLTLEYSPRLPADLRLKEADEEPLNFLHSPDNFCTVLYNDETHTFDQVITTLARVVKCSHRDAIEYVNNVDREGRTVVKCATFPQCTELKQEIERVTSKHAHRPLKVDVVHAHVIAHQIYAMRLLTWLQKLLTECEGFRSVFSEVVLQVKLPDTSIVEGILLRDSALWKAARLHWHRLFISGMLMEYESKKAFAKVFTKNYGSVMKDFIRDDHEHSFSIASLAVQIYTVPTVAHYLIAHEDVLLTLMNTFISECSRKTNKLTGKLAFERNAPNGACKRAQVVLSDLRYLLGAIPEVWTDDLRKGILQGVTLLLTLLNMMQGMDAVTRQVGQHMEYEPEWESAFNLHIQLQLVITLMLKWCGSDRVVLIKAYRATLKKLYENPSFNPSSVGEVRELADHSASCLQYDVSSQPVSIHLPLSRFLAGLHLYLEKFGLNFDSPEFQIFSKQSPEQIIEPVLRTQVMISQVHAGMWRRNGYALLNQLYFYHNVKCRSEMLDKDIVLLQIGASLIESNEFLIHLLNKYNLINWANPMFEVNSLKNPEEDSIRQTISLVEEFLGLLITLIGERYNPGVGKVTHDDCIKNEIIQQLCIKPLSHSELDKTLPDDDNDETGMENVINDVAIFKKPNQTSGKGVYELKPHLVSNYNVFFYHYTREELSKSEEEQRNRRKQAGELECCPPPTLPPLSESFSMMANLLQCDVMLHIMHTVLERSWNLRARSFSEPQLNKVLHLIGYALHEEELQTYQFFLFTERAEKWKLVDLMQMLSKSPRIEAHKDLLTWVLTKYRKVSAVRSSGSQTLQIESVYEPSSSSQEEAAKEEKKWRAAKAAEKRAKIMAQMTAMQKNFMKENAKLFQNTENYSETEDVSGSNMDVAEIIDESPICLGPKQTTRLCPKKTYTCILCQETQTVTADGPALVYAAFVQKSTVLCRNRNIPHDKENEQEPLFLSSNLGPAPHTSTCGHVMHSNCWQRYFDNVLAKENRRPYRIRQPSSFDVEKNEFVCPLCECLSNTVLPLIPALGTLQQEGQDIFSLNLDEWLSSLIIALKHKKRIQKSKANTQQSGSKPENLTTGKKTSSKSEVPSISDDTPSNSLIALATPSPSAEDETNISTDIFSSDDELEDEPVSATKDICFAENDVVMQVLLYSRADQNCESSGEASSSQPKPQTQLSNDLSDMIMLFSQATFTKGLGAHPNQDDQRVPLMAWKSCSYTIQSLEWLTRHMGKPVLGHHSSRQQDCLEGLVRLAGVLGSTWKQEQVINTHALRLLTLILENPSHGPSLLDWDSFGVLVPLTISIPSLFYTEQPIPIPMGTTLELHILHMMFISNMAQIILCSDLERNGIPMEEENCDESDTECLREIITTLRGNIEMSTASVWKIVQENSIPFLRCCVLFYHYLTGVPAPQVLTEVGGDTFVNMCTYLGLSPSCKELLQPISVINLIRKWASHNRVVAWLNQQDIKPFPYRNFLTVNCLMSLPEDYSELINTVGMFTCPNSEHEDSRNPTMCLICGEMLCSQSYCCQTELNKSPVSNSILIILS